MAAWSFVLGVNGVPLAELATGSGRVLTYTRNGVADARISLSHDDDAASALFDALGAGIPRLEGYREAPDGTKVRRFHGDLAPFDEQLEEAALANLVFRDPFARLLGYGQSRGRFTAASRKFTATDAGQIAKALIDETPSVGIATTGTIQASKVRDRSYQYANIGEAIVALTRVLDGFDFEVAPIAYSGGNIGQFIVYASQGSDRSSTVRFEYGPETLANVRQVTRQMEPPINVARVIGANGLVGLKPDAASIAKYGEWWVQETASDVAEQATLDDKAQSLLRPEWIKVVAFSPDPTLAPSPWDDFWLGDLVSFYGRREAFTESVPARVNKVTVVIDDEGEEAYEVEQPGADGDVTTAGVEVEIV